MAQISYRQIVFPYWLLLQVLLCLGSELLHTETGDYRQTAHSSRSTGFGGSGSAAVQTRQAQGHTAQ